MYYREPGLYTDQLNPFQFNGLNWPFLHDCGFTWVTFQVYNPQIHGINLIDFDLDSVRKHGFTNVGVWGVIYTHDDFYNGGKRLGQQAVHLGAQHLIVDCEQVYKDTRPSRDGLAIIQGIRDGGWSAGVSLSTLGSPTNPSLFDFAMDTTSFMQSGPDASVHPQDYYNDSSEYTPANSEIYWPRIGVSSDRLNHTIGLYPGKHGKVDGANWVILLKTAKVGKNFSVYMAQDGLREDYLALRDYIKSISPTPLPGGPTSTETKAIMIDAADEWLQGRAVLLTRIQNARRILKSNDPQWNQVSTVIKKILDDAGIPV